MIDALDPDWDDVPPDLAALDGQHVSVNGEEGILVIVPGLMGDARRKAEQAKSTKGQPCDGSS